MTGSRLNSTRSSRWGYRTIWRSKSTKHRSLFLHGDDDQIVPIANSAMLAVKLVKKGTLKVYKGVPHGMCTTHKNEVNEDLLAFIKG